MALRNELRSADQGIGRETRCRSNADARIILVLTNQEAETRTERIPCQRH